MSLQAELDNFKASWLDRVGPDVAKLVDDDLVALQALAAKASKAGDRFPAVTLNDHLGRSIDVSALASQQPLIVTFYRGGWCPYCNLELRAYQKQLPEIEALGGKLVAVSNDVSFPVLSDSQGRLADALGIRFELSPAIHALYKKLGHDLAARNGDDKWALPMPATFVVAKGGIIAHAAIDPDYRKRLDPEIAIALLRQLTARSAV
jgi:peroxiredoxin